MSDARRSTPDDRAASGTDASVLLRAFAAAAPRPLTIADLRQAGVAMPGQTLYELQLTGYRVTRVYGRDGSHRRQMLGYRLD